MWKLYEGLIRLHLIPAFNKIRLKNQTVDHIQKLVNDKNKEGFSKRTIQYIKSTLHTALNQAIRNRLIINNVAEAVTLPNKKPKERRILSQQEQQALIQALEGERKGFMVFICIIYGFTLW